jgi:hypothetical protein
LVFLLTSRTEDVCPGLNCFLYPRLASMRCYHEARGSIYNCVVCRCYPGPSWRAEGQRWCTGQAAHWGTRALQTVRPWEMSKCEKSVQSFRHTSATKSRSILSGVVSVVNPRRRVRRCTCVSTAIPCGRPKAFPNTTLAVFRPTPGSPRSASIVSGTAPLCCCTRAVQQR